MSPKKPAKSRIGSSADDLHLSMSRVVPGQEARTAAQALPGLPHHRFVPPGDAPKGGGPSAIGFETSNSYIASERQAEMTPGEGECFEGLVPESWCCVDCDKNTAPGFLNRADMEKAVKALGEKWHTEEEGITLTFNINTEVFHVRDAVWKAAGMGPKGQPVYRFHCGC